jgi:polysaccharide export outer membrane protein
MIRRARCLGAIAASGLTLFSGGVALGQSGGGDDYRIGPLDRLDITVFHVKDLSLDKAQVDAAGRIAFPLIGSVIAGGRTAGELSTDIARRLGVDYLQAPEVSVVVAEAVRQKVSVEGAVNEAGVFDLKGRTGLMEAVAEARGESRTGNPHRVAIVRQVDGAPHAARFDLVAIRAGRARDPELMAGDVVVVDGSGFKIFWRSFVETLPGLFVFSYI